MFWFELLIALAIALILSAVLFAVGWEQPYQGNAWGGVVVWFVILLLVIWTGGAWLTPFGPRFWDVAWLPFLIIGVLTFLLLLMAVPKARRWRQPRTRRAALEQVDAAQTEEAVVASAFGCIFWMLIGLLIIALLSRYTFYPRPVLPPTVSSLEQGIEFEHAS